jgi:hypothetical protein
LQWHNCDSSSNNYTYADCYFAIYCESDSFADIYSNAESYGYADTNNHCNTSWSFANTFRWTPELPNI